MGEEQGLSAENRRLIERVFAWATPDQLPIACFPAIRLDELERLLNAARSEGLHPLVDADALATLRLMHDNRQGCVGAAQRAERQALAIVLKRFAPEKP